MPPGAWGRGRGAARLPRERSGVTLLTAAQSDAIDAEVARIEARTGVEIVAVVTAKSSHYPQIPWKAFALGVSLAAAALVLADVLRPDWPSSRAALLHVVAMLAAGAVLALSTVFVPGIARLFLRAMRRDFEVHRCARDMFLRHEVFATHDRTGVLLLVSVFERKLEIVADRGFDGRVTPAEWRAAIERMAPRAAAQGPAAALHEGLDAIEALLVEKGFRPAAAAPNELPDAPREEREP